MALCGWAGLRGGAENSGGDACPAAMIFDLLLSPTAENGLGITAGFLDLEAFRGVGQTLPEKGLGFSILQDRSTPAKDLVLEILRHVDRLLYVAPTKGLLTPRLVRFNYDAASLS